ncbi:MULTISPECIES: type IV pilus modification protein PilV [Variovorax]|uniref:type IV pilus modification protein PilV n=1 Tax=Variovorax atrisoli TaxID=3394203 RepID=UPI000F7E63FD|nr:MULTISPECIES: type IV pilus modification protein PilV [Variovorax]MBB3637996.1 type IV pilus assembly protein PilV [Variovorax sp. BK613]MDR6518474.1 type IV pilus assembly protein PilV [Variovorax paradoxus]RTD98470.1 type IV pilus modification protein PilV [Variovorax sp. 369]
MLMRRPRVSRAQRVQPGFSMIEALVALLVLSLGLLALAGFQVRVLVDSVGASNQNLAIQLAGDLADRIRANPAAAATTPSRYVTDWSAASANGPRPSCEGLKAACNAAELAAHDLWNWKRAIAAALPGGAADVRASATAGGVLLMHLAWDEPAVLDPIAPDPDWQCPTGKACLEVSVAVPQP